MRDELVHVPRLVAEPRLPVAALLRRPELVLEERVVLRPDDHEVVRHISGTLRVCFLPPLPLDVYLFLSLSLSLSVSLSLLFALRL